MGRNCCGTYTGKLALGAWYYSATFDDLTKVHSDGQRSGATGIEVFICSLTGMVYQDTTHPDRQMTLFGRLGIGDPP